MSNWQNLTNLVIDKCLDTFGEDVIFTSSELTPITIQAIFDNSFQTIDPQSGAVVISTQPMIGIKDSDLPNPPSKGDLVQIRGIDYRIIDYQPDGEGSSRLLLHKK